MNTIRLENITKVIKGEEVLKDISVELTGGKIYGIVGKNGSGKSMLFRAMSDLIHTDGNMYLNGKKMEHGLPRGIRTGLVIENVNLHMDLNAMDNLTALAKINGYIGKQEIKEALANVGLDPENKKKVRTYSLGMRQKLILAQAIMEHPDLYLLDEPTNALDEKSVKKFHDILKKEAERGAIILIASHSREDIEVLCDEVFHMERGVLTAAKGGDKE